MAVAVIGGLASRRSFSIATRMPSAGLVFLVSRRLGPIAAAFVGLHTATDGLGRDTGSDFDIGLLDGEAALDWSSSAATIGSG